MTGKALAARKGGPGESAPELTGSQKAAMVLVQLGQARALRVLQEMSETEVLDLMAEVANLPTLEAQDIRGVVAEFSQRVQRVQGIGQGGKHTVHALLRERLGEARAEEVLMQLTSAGRAGPLAFIATVDPRQIVSMLTDEHPQTIAVVLANTPPDHAALVLADLPEKIRAEVARRIAELDRVAPEAIVQAASVLERKLSSLAQASTASASDGVSSLVEILNRSDRTTEKLVLAELEGLNSELAEQVRSRMFTFDDILSVDDRSLQLVLRKVEIKELAVALKGVPDPVRDKISKNISERAATDLKEELSVLGPLRTSQVDAAQMAVVQVIRELEASGEIVLSRGSDDLVA